MARGQRRKGAGFTNAERKQVEVDMMHITSQYDVLTGKDGAPTALKMPYAANGFSMILVKDSDCSPADFSVVEKFRVDEAESKEADVKMPKFKIETTTSDLPTMLKKGGLDDIFIPGKADLSGITLDPGGLVVTQVIQMAVIEVDEGGTEAAAATVVVGALKCCPPPRDLPPPFYLDKPFCFYLVKELDPTSSGKKDFVTLFSGKVNDPSKKE